MTGDDDGLLPDELTLFDDDGLPDVSHRARPDGNSHDKVSDAAGSKKRDPEQIEAERQRIRGAQEAKLNRINSQYALAAEGGKVWVIEHQTDPNFTGRRVLVRVATSEWSKLYMNEFVGIVGDGKIQYKELPGWWLRHPDRRTYRGGIVLNPDRTPPGCFNLWQGYAVTPAPGSWNKLKNHIREIICASDEILFQYLMDWLARLFQKPGKQGGVAIVLKGKEGAGKGILCRAVLDILGQHGLHITSPTHLVGRFNSHLRDCIALFADEAFFAGDRQHVGVLKALITEPSIAIEGKGRDVVVAKNLLHVMMASNEDWVVPAGPDARRYAVFAVSEVRLNDYPYFKSIQAELDAGGREAMLHELLNRDISVAVPDSEGLQEQRARSPDSLGQWWMAVLDRGFLYKSKYGTPWFHDWHDFYTTELLYRAYLQFCAEAKPYGVKSRELLGKFMRKLYQDKRAPAPGDPIFEIDSIEADRNVPRYLDELAIARSKLRAYGYDVGTLDQAVTSQKNQCTSYEVGHISFRHFSHVFGMSVPPNEDMQCR